MAERYACLVNTVMQVPEKQCGLRMTTASNFQTTLILVNVGDQKFELLPVITLSASCKPATIVLDQTGIGTLHPDAIKAQILYSGICEGDLFVTTDQEFFDCADVGTRQVTLTASNGAGLNASCVATVTVIDNSLPSIECPASKIISSKQQICSGTVGSWSPVLMEDNCMSGLSVTYAGPCYRLEWP